jgi:uncharacterized membrane protein YfcA
MFGFGYGITSLAFLPYLISVKIAVPMIAVQIPLYTAYMIYGLRRHLTFRFAVPLIVGTLLGLPLGVNLLRILSEETVQRLLGAFILLYCLFSTKMSLQKEPVIKNNAWGVLAGFLSGIVGGAILASGPIVIAYLNLRGVQKEVFKATFLVWAMAMACLIVPFYALTGVLTYQALLMGMGTIPFAALGLFLGIKLFKIIKEQVFYRLVIIFLVITGIRLLVS